MTSALEQLLARIQAEDPYSYRPKEVRDLQIAAANERLQGSRAVIGVLDQRARDVGVERIDSLDDLVPLLFSHDTYKSYPDSFIAHGRWKAMSAWVDTLSTRKGATDVDVSGVATVDEWLGRLDDAGHFVYASSGTSGKCSLAQETEADRELVRAMLVTNMRWVAGVEPDRDRPTLIFFPSAGFNRGVAFFHRVVSVYGRPGAVHFLSDEPILVEDMNAMGRLNRALSDGAALPSDLVAFQEGVAARQARMGEGLGRMTDAFLRHRHEPMFIMALWGQHYGLVEAVRARGEDDGVHPESVFFAGGGLKGAVLPPDYEEQVRSFYGVGSSRFLHIYGMTEINTTLPACASGRYHCPPWTIPLVVDKAGERLVEPDDGRLVGRMAFFDLSVDGRWGGVISGDRVTVDINPCPCGSPSPAVSDIARYRDLPEGDEKLTCSGTINAYVRGAIEP